MAIRLHVWGERACFVRPEFKLERISYDVMTPAAARGILAAIHWRPSICWHVERIQILRPIRFESIGEEAPDALAINHLRGKRSIYARRAAIILIDVAYVIEAHLSLTDMAGPEDNLAKHISMFNRQVSRGRSRRPPCLGIQNFPARVAVLRDSEAPPASSFPAHPERIDLGWMLHDIDYAHGRIARYFRAEIFNGVMTIPSLDSPDLAA